jgi:septal ring factor EnvC (AmiA/AmiB activator)
VLKPFFYCYHGCCLVVLAMGELKNQASKIKQEQENQLDEITKTSVEQKSTNEIINTYEKEIRKFEEELSGINLTQDI